MSGGRLSLSNTISRCSVSDINNSHFVPDYHVILAAVHCHIDISGTRQGAQYCPKPVTSWLSTIQPFFQPFPSFPPSIRCLIALGNLPEFLAFLLIPIFRSYQRNPPILSSTVWRQNFFEYMGLTSRQTIYQRKPAVLSTLGH
jgi:hypothetical protein